jgi:hypothetical protein
MSLLILFNLLVIDQEGFQLMDNACLKKVASKSWLVGVLQLAPESADVHCPGSSKL